MSMFVANCLKKAPKAPSCIYKKKIIQQSPTTKNKNNYCCLMNLIKFINVLQSVEILYYLNKFDNRDMFDLDSN